MALVRLLLTMLVLVAVALFGVYLLRNNRAVVASLLKNAGVLDRDDAERPPDRMVSERKWTVSRGMLYAIGAVFVLAGIIGAVVQVRKFLHGM